MKCRLFNLIYRIVPFNFIKVIVINLHFSKCPFCGDLEISDEQIKTDLEKLKYSVEKFDLWPGIKKEIKSRNEVRKIRPGFLQWGYAAAAGLVLILAFSFNLLNVKGRFFDEKVKDEGSGEKVVVKFIEIDGKEARGFFFNSGNRDRLIVWAQKNKEG